MSSVWANALHRASYGGVEFDCLTTRDSITRSVVRRTYPRRDGGHLQEMGSEPRTTQVQIIFFERPAIEGEDFFQSDRNHLERFESFFNATQKGIAQDFIHPLTGKYVAMVEDLSFEASAEDEDTIHVDCTFVEDTTEPAVFQPGVIAPLDAGTAAVRVQAQELEEELTILGIVSPIPDLALALSEAWESTPLITVREVTLALASAAAAIDDAMNELDLVTSVERYPVWRSMQRLLFGLRRAADAFRQRQPALTTIVVIKGQPLRALVAEQYGAQDGARLVDDVARLNDIDDPSYVPEGTRLQIPIIDAGRRQVLRRAA